MSQPQNTKNTIGGPTHVARLQVAPNKADPISFKENRPLPFVSNLEFLL